MNRNVMFSNNFTEFPVNADEKFWDREDTSGYVAMQLFSYVPMQLCSYLAM
jgi:hypothetical protein